MPPRTTPYACPLRARLLCALLMLTAAACEAPLLEGLDEPQANDLIVALAGVGIDADKRGRLGRFTVEVDRADFAAAWRIARARGLPHQSARAPGLWASRSAEDVELRSAEFARLLRSDPAVADARVVFGRRGAAVSLRVIEPTAVDPQRVAARVRAVAGFGAADPVTVDIHPLDAPSPQATPARSAGTRAPLWLASAAVGLMLVGCGFAWSRSRRVRVAS